MTRRARPRWPPRSGLMRVAGGSRYAFPEAQRAYFSASPPPARPAGGRSRASIAARGPRGSLAADGPRLAPGRVPRQGQRAGHQGRVHVGRQRLGVRQPGLRQRRLTRAALERPRWTVLGTFGRPLAGAAVLGPRRRVGVRRGHLRQQGARRLALERARLDRPAVRARPDRRRRPGRERRLGGRRQAGRALERAHLEAHLAGLAAAEEHHVRARLAGRHLRAVADQRLGGRLGQPAGRGRPGGGAALRRARLEQGGTGRLRQPGADRARRVRRPVDPGARHRRRARPDRPLHRREAAPGAPCRSAASG